MESARKERRKAAEAVIQEYNTLRVNLLNGGHGLRNRGAVTAFFVVRRNGRGVTDWTPGEPARAAMEARG